MPGKWQDVCALIAGCGSIGKRHGRILRELGVREILACDPSPEQRERLSAEVPDARVLDDYTAALRKGPDVVFICTPPRMHVPMAMQAIRAGCDVFTEKPLSVKSEGIDDLDALAKQAGKIVMVGLCFRYHQGLRLAKSWLDQGRIGRLVSIRAMAGEHLPDVRPDYRTLFSAQYSGAFDLTHEVDLAIWFAGAKVRRTLAMAGSLSHIDITADDVAEILIEFEDPCIASIHLDFFQRARRRQTEILGTRGTLLIEFARWDECTVSVYDGGTRTWTHTHMPTDRDDMFRDEDREFLESVAAREEPACTIAEGRKSVEVVEAAIEAAHRGRA